MTHLFEKLGSGISFSSNSKFKFTPVDFQDPRNIEPTYRIFNKIKYRLVWNTENERVGMPPGRGEEYIPLKELLKLNKK